MSDSDLLFVDGENKLAALPPMRMIEIAAFPGAAADSANADDSDGAFAAAREILAEQFKLPSPPQYGKAAMTDDGKVAVLQTAPRRLLVIADESSSAFAAGDALSALNAGLKGNAAAAAQDAAYRGFRMMPLAFARRLLARGAAIDLHPAAFPAGAFAKTLLNHTDTLILNRGDYVDIYAPRSYTASLIKWLQIAAAAAAKEEDEEEQK